MQAVAKRWEFKDASDAFYSTSPSVQQRQPFLLLPPPPFPSSLIFCSFVIRRPRDKNKKKQKHCRLITLTSFLPSFSSITLPLFPHPRQLKLSFRAYNFTSIAWFSQRGNSFNQNTASGRGLKPGEPESKHILLPLADGTSICAGRSFRRWNISSVRPPRPFSSCDRATDFLCLLKGECLVLLCATPSRHCFSPRVRDINKKQADPQVQRFNCRNFIMEDVTSLGINFQRQKQGKPINRSATRPEETTI